MQVKMKCAVYTRVSTDMQAEKEFNSCEAQEAKIRSFIDSQENFEIYKVYADPGYTGANTNRPALNELLNDIKQNKINLIISYKIDRLTRSPRDFYQLIELFDKYGVNFISVTERFDTSTPSGRLLRNIMLTFAQFERELTSERTRDKMMQRAQKGMWNGGVAPFGYKTENKKLVINEPEAKVVKTIFETYLLNNASVKVYYELRDRGIKDRRGLPFSKTVISYILRNPIYCGKFRYADKLWKGTFEPIISETVFEEAQKVHKDRNFKTKVYREYPLAGLVRCQECNSFMTPSHTNKRKKGKLQRYYYYRCTATTKRNWSDCSTRQVSADRLEDYIFENLERMSLDEQYIHSSVLRLNFPQAGGRIGLEPTNEPPKITPEIFGQTLALFVKGLREKKGIEKSFWAKKFIQSIGYSKEKVVVNLNTFTNCLPPLSETNQNSLINEKEKGEIPFSLPICQFDLNKNAARPGLEPGAFSSRGRRATITPPGKFCEAKLEHLSIRK